MNMSVLGKLFGKKDATTTDESLSGERMKSTADQEKIRALLQPLFDDYEVTMQPPSEVKITAFARKARLHGISEQAIDELTCFYRLTNGVPCLNSLDFHQCDDDILYEWWDSEKSLWLATKDDDIVRWVNGKYCLGDAGNTSLGEGCEFATLASLIESALTKWSF
ncbi:MAG: hypothetical protein LBN10_09960 [Propionibacteriaceae bacterium]|jgi:hypothetical protein|nr:hypothetical protein [Propionibacteriaceae bacterium]